MCVVFCSPVVASQFPGYSMATHLVATIFFVFYFIFSHFRRGFLHFSSFRLHARIWCNTSTAYENLHNEKSPERRPAGRDNCRWPHAFVPGSQ